MTTRTLELIGAARSEVGVASPYLVPGEHDLRVLREAIANNVHVSLYEPMPNPDRDAERRADESALESHGSLGRLHAKLTVVDDCRLFIGSMNMDRRSARWNTEIGLVIESPERAGEVKGLLQRERLPGSYRLRIASGRRSSGRSRVASIVERAAAIRPAGLCLRI